MRPRYRQGLFGRVIWRGYLRIHLIRGLENFLKISLCDRCIWLAQRLKVASAAFWCLFIGAILSSSEPVVALPTENELIVGIFPRRSPTELMEAFAPLANYLTQYLGRPVRLETSPDFRSFWEAVSSKRYHLVHYNQYHYLRSHKEFGYKVVAKNEEGGRDHISGVIVIRKDSGIKRIEDLRGKRIIFGGNNQAMGSYIMPTYILRQAGLKKGDYIEEFALNPPNVALAVFFKRADAGGSGNIVFELPFVQDKIDVSKMEYLAHSETIAHLPWAVSGEMPVSERDKIQRALLTTKSAPQGERILKSASLSNLVIATDDEYTLARKMIYEITGEQF